MRKMAEAPTKYWNFLNIYGFGEGFAEELEMGVF